MADAPTTRHSLLMRLRDRRNEAAWSLFVEIYAPLIYGLARKKGLQDADAADLTQGVLQSVAGAAKDFQYDPQKSFRGWLFTIVRNRLRDFHRAENRRATAVGDTATQSLIEQQTRDAHELAQWEREHERRLFQVAAEKVRAEVQESTWQAFQQTAVEGKPGKKVAESLGMSVAAVYLAKSRVMARIREKIQEIDGP